MTCRTTAPCCRCAVLWRGSIRPITPCVPVPTGTKFIVRGVLFKFPELHALHSPDGDTRHRPASARLAQTLHSMYADACLWHVGRSRPYLAVPACCTVDVTWCRYHEHRFAMKSAQHELKGYSALASLVGSIDGLDVPLAATIDYRGFRLLAVSLLPLTPATYKLDATNKRRLAAPGSLV